jgi:RNA polymerase sigma-70 factor (ECF subfamily)
VFDNSGVELASLVKMPGKSESDSDAGLIRRLKARDGRAMVDLYDRYGRLLYSVILRAVNDSATAEDVLQETLMRVWNRIHTFDETKGRLEGWLVTVARNRALDHLRANQTSPLVATTDLEHLERASMFHRSESHADRIAQQKAVNAALQSLNGDQRQVIELIHFEGLTQTEIAAKLGRPLGTVKGIVRSALRCLRTAMAGGVS